jgi:hypothetical protein
MNGGDPKPRRGHAGEASPGRFVSFVPSVFVVSIP